MGKQHDTFPGERQEMPPLEDRPELDRPTDPSVREVPQEDPQVVPDELPPDENPQEEPVL
jgi:hypothetical protein